MCVCVCELIIITYLALLAIIFLRFRFELGADLVRFRVHCHPNSNVLIKR